MLNTSRVIRFALIGIFAFGLTGSFFTSTITLAQGTAPATTGAEPDPSAAITKLRKGLKDTAGYESAINTVTEGPGLPGIIGKLIGGVLSFLAVAFFGLAMYAGFRWMFARDDEAVAKKSVATITAAISGLIVIIGAYAITNFVLDSIGVKEGGVTAPAGSEPAAGAAHIVPVGAACLVDDDCVTGAVCFDGSCSDNQCIIQYAARGYACQQESRCERSTIVRNLCPGTYDPNPAVNVVCCRTANDDLFSESCHSLTELGTTPSASCAGINCSQIPTEEVCTSEEPDEGNGCCDWF